MLDEFSEFLSGDPERAFKAQAERLLAAQIRLDEPYSGEGIEYLDRARPFLPTINEHGWDEVPELGMTIASHYARTVLLKRFAYAIPDERALAAIAKLSPIVEVGAGSGYWAKLLRERGAQVAPYDHLPYPLLSGWITYSWAAVSKGGPAKAMRHHPERTLFLCWPYMNSMAAECVRLHRGEYVAYIGEGMGGCTGNDEFHILLRLLYEEIDYIKIPRWFGLHDHLSIWRRHDFLTPEIEDVLKGRLADDRYDWDDE